MNYDEAIMTTTDIAKMLDVKPANLDWRLKKSNFPFTGKHPGTGKGRKYSFNHLIALSIMEDLLPIKLANIVPVSHMIAARQEERYAV